jgi:hypothetical protein
MNQGVSLLVDVRFHDGHDLGLSVSSHCVLATGSHLLLVDWNRELAGYRSDESYKLMPPGRNSFKMFSGIDDGAPPCTRGPTISRTDGILDNELEVQVGVSGYSGRTHLKTPVPVIFPAIELEIFRSFCFRVDDRYSYTCY